MNQHLVYVIGPSGAGKDSLLAWLLQHAPADWHVHRARRTITRAPEPEGEAHESVDEAQFAMLRAQHAFAIDWQAHGLHYGVRHEEFSALDSGHWVLLNGSRQQLPLALQRWPQLTVLHITASPQILVERLNARGREDAAQRRARAQRATAAALELPPGAIEIRNEGPLDEVGQMLLQALHFIAVARRA